MFHVSKIYKIAHLEAKYNFFEKRIALHTKQFNYDVWKNDFLMISLSNKNPSSKDWHKMMTKGCV